ncbi:MAG: hypothetical protein AB8C84_10650 [Oligoflexales bacterium]
MSQSFTKMLEVSSVTRSERVPWEAVFILFLIFAYIIWRIWSYHQDDTVHGLYLNCEIEHERKKGDEKSTQGYVCDLGSHDARLVTPCYMGAERVALSMPSFPGNDGKASIVHGHVIKSQILDQDSWLVDVHFDDDESRIKEMMSAITKHPDLGVSNRL